MIGQIKNNGLQNASFLKSGYANAVIRTEPDFFSMKIDGKEYAVNHPAHQQDIKEFLAASGVDRKETVAAVLHKGIEPTKENLELVHSALNEDPFQSDSDAFVKEELDAEIIEKLDLPPEVKERITGSKDLLKAIRSLLLEADGQEMNHLGLREAISVLIRRFKIPSDAGGEIREVGNAVELGLSASADGVSQDFTIAMPDNIAISHQVDAEKKSLRGETDSLERREAALPRPDALFSKDLEDAKIGYRPFSESGPFHARDSKRQIRDVLVVRANRKGAEVSSAFLEKDGIDSRKDERADAMRAEDMDSRRKEEKKLSEPHFSEDEALHIAELVNLALSMVDSDLRKVFADLEIKTYLVSTIDERMSAARKEFDEMKTSVIQSLEKGSIAKSIELLTKSIQKSSFAMLTDMPTEKKLLISLSRLEEATMALKNKDVQLADKIVREVQDLLRQIEFKPSSRRIQAMIAQKVQSAERTLQEKNSSIQDKVLEAIRLHSSGTARDLLELVRFSGANHEIEKYENSSGIGNLKNLKELFSDSSFSAMMSGEQMLNNSDDQRRRDFYVLDIPLQIEDEIAGLKVFVGGKCDENRLDWKNAELYFALKLKEEKVGLKFSIKDAGVAIEMIGDRELKMENLKEPLAEIGYRLLSVKNSPVSSGRRLPLQVGGTENAVVREESDSKFEAKI